MDKKLVLQAKKHDKEAFVKLVENYQVSMYKTAIAILQNDEDAADAIQETILICWEKIGSLRNAKFFKTWMTRILIHQLRMERLKWFSCRKQEQLPLPHRQRQHSIPPL